MQIKALDRKALRDMWRMRGQIAAIALIIASGVAVLVMSLSTLESLDRTTAAYYERYHFADVFAFVKRAPVRVLPQIADIEGVRTVADRIMQMATLDIEGFKEPAMAQFVSVPQQHQPVLNQLVLRQGRWIGVDRPDEVIVNEPFAHAHGLMPGDQLVAVLNGRRRALRVVGVALSPEFVYSIAPGALMPDDRRFGIVWMGRDALAAAFDLQGAFNSVTLALYHHASLPEVLQRLDQTLATYGGVGAIARADQLSNWFVSNEMDQLRTMSSILPAIFLAIAAFLTNMLLRRLLAIERSQIGLLKAFGYAHWEVGLHYLKIVLGLALLGIAGGCLLGFALGRYNTQLYADVFRFPLLLYQPSLAAIAIAAAATLGSSLLGAASAVSAAVKLPPAQAMLPPSPPIFHRSWFSRSPIGRWPDQATRIILRNIGRWWPRAALTTLGLAASVALLVLALQWKDALEYLAQTYFFDAQRQHLAVGVAEAQGPELVADLARLPGVLAAEPSRIVSADLSVGPRTHRGGIIGVPVNATLQPIYDDLRQRTLPAPAEGLILGSFLARKLDVQAGDEVWVSILEGRRPELAVPIVDIVDTYIGMPAYMNLEALQRILGEGPRVEYVNLLLNTDEQAELFNQLRGLPVVSAIMVRQAAIDSFHATVMEHIMVFITIFSVLACVMGFGVAYNSARITLSESGRELATLRVLGFTRGEISYILLGEVGFLLALSLPLGCWLGYQLANLIGTMFNNELFRVPMIITPFTYGFAVLIMVLATLVSALIVRVRVDRLDLVAVLKSRE